MNTKKTKKIPLYLQLKNQLLKQIEEELKEGDMLPPEPEIEQKYKVSRITVRKAIEELANDGIVIKKQGLGTIVQSKQIIQEAGMITSWTEEMSSKGKKIETTHLELYEIEPSKKMINTMKLEKNEAIICLKRIRCTNGEPIAVMINYLRKKFIPGFLEKGLTRESLYEELESVYDIQLEKADETVQARIASDLECNSLKIPPYSAVLHISRVSYLPDGTPFEMVEMTNRSDRYSYHLQLNGRKKKKK